MRTPEQVRWDFVQEWLKRASDDLRAARLLIEQEFDDYEAAAFHAQQCAEKLIKAYLIRYQVEFPKTHDIERLRMIIANRDTVLARQLADADALSPYAVEFRYPGDLDVVSRDAARDAIGIAERVQNVIRRVLEEYLKAGRPQ